MAIMLAADRECRVMASVFDCRFTSPTETGYKSTSSSRIKGTTNWDQLRTAARIAAVAIPGAQIGRSILKSTCQREAPSTIAASSISYGMVSKYPFKNQVVKGSTTAEETTTKPT